MNISPKTDAKITLPWAEPPAPGTATEVAPGILWMRLPLPMKLDHVNIYALDEGDSWTLIDTGIDWPKARKVWAALLSGPLAAKPIGRIIVTHHHPDHIGLAGWLMAKFDAPLLMPRTGWLMARMLMLDIQDRPSAEAVTFLRRSGMDANKLAQKTNERPFNFADFTTPLPACFTRLTDGQIINMAGRDWTIHMAGGHAPEHATFWSRSDKLVLGGDQLLASISPNIGVYPTEPEADPLTDWLESCADLAQYATPEQLVLPGHKLPFTGLPLRIGQLADNHHSALIRLRDFLQTGRRGPDCFPLLFKRKIGTEEYGLALAETVAHLNHLLLQGHITRRFADDGAWIWQSV